MEVARLSPPDDINPSPEHQVNLFFSVDLVNATKFKAKHSKEWVSIFNSFYELLLSYVQTVYQQESIWKLNGDEISLRNDKSN